MYPEAHSSIAIDRRMHKACDETNSSRSRMIMMIISSLNHKLAACLLRTALIMSILQVLKNTFRRGLAYTRAKPAQVYAKCVGSEKTLALVPSETLEGHKWKLSGILSRCLP